MPEVIYSFPPDCNCAGMFERFYYDWNRTLFFHVRQKADVDLAREVCQQVWTEIWEAIKSGVYEYLTPGLLVYRADSRLKDHYRKEKRFRQLDPTEHDTAYRLNLDERIDYHTALAALPEDERRTFTLSFREGLTQAEIADQQGISTRTVRRTWDRAVTHLRQFLSGEAAG